MDRNYSSTSAWHAMSTKDVLNVLDTQLSGLSAAEVNARLLHYGYNRLPPAKARTRFIRFISQFNNILIYVLLSAAGITLVLKQWVDTIVILLVVMFNAAIGYFQEAKAEKAIAALTEMLALKATVIRNAKRMKIAAKDLVPGDIIILQTGDKVPADVRLLKTNNLQINEAILTGESMPIEKQVDPDPHNAVTADRKSLAYSGTLVTYGSGVGVVVDTGSTTEVGRISALLSSKPVFSTPLLKQLAVFAKRLAMIILVLTLMIFLFGIFVRHYSFTYMFLAAVAIAVAFIPEGLPAIMTIALAIGVTRMAEKHAIIRRLASVETLSSVTVICTDKTGTLTKNELTIQTIILSNHKYQVSGSGYDNHGTIQIDSHSVHVNNEPDLLWLTKAGMLCNEAELQQTDNHWHLLGNPVDGAFLTLALKAKLNAKNEKHNLPIVDIIPFDSQHKLMASLHHDHEGNFFTFVKGAPEKLLDMCTQQRQDNQNIPLNKAYWLKEINHLAQQGMRVLGIAFHQSQHEQLALNFKNLSDHLVLLGIVGIIDPPREEVPAAIKQCLQAGITIKMVTGDHALTAQAIAKQIDILTHQVLIGDNLDALSDEQLAHIINDVNVYARMSPQHKIRLINALHQKQQIVAMTGDGVNDAPALQTSDIGIAMGSKGTDVAKEAAEIVLTDDNFTSIKDAVAEGRNVYLNLKKAILFVLPTSGAEGLAIFLAIIFNFTLPITPLQILWVNTITAITLGLALAFEPPEPKLMQQQPRNPYEPLLSKLLLWRMLFVSVLFVLFMFAIFIYETQHGSTITMARTMVVDLLVVFEAIYLLNCRRIYSASISKESIFASKYSLLAIAIVLLLQVSFTYLPFMQNIFQSQSLSISAWFVIIILAIIAFIIIEIEKMIIRHAKR